jgi:hypothetical protein
MMMHSTSARWAGCRRHVARQRRSMYRAWPLSHQVRVEFADERPMFRVITEFDLDEWAFQSKDPMLRFSRAVDALTRAGRTGDVREQATALYLLPRCDYRRQIQALRVEAYRKAHRPRRSMPTKLTHQQCEQIKERLAAGESQASLAREYGVSATYIFSLKYSKRMNW